MRLSIHGSDTLQSQSSWVLQTTEDGSEQYYYNIQTQEMRYSMPPDFYSDDQIHNSYDFERPPMRPVRAANRVIADDYRRTTQNFMDPLPSRATSTIPPSIFAKEDEFEDHDQVRNS